jgi:hypothetical protein
LVAATQQIADWLKKLGLSEYVDRFVENHIDESIIQELTDQDLETLRDLPDIEQLEEAGLLSKQKLLAGALPGDLRDGPDLINEEEGAGEDGETDEPALALAADDL